MVIDIISYTDKQLAALSTEKVLEIREAQLKKNQLQAELQERLKKEKQALIDRGIYPSNVWARLEAKLTAEYEKQVEILRDSLVFYLHYVADGAPITTPDVPYEVDYSLSEEERAVIVKNYYERTYIPYEILARLSNEIINKVRGVNRVVYDISSKTKQSRLYI